MPAKLTAALNRLGETLKSFTIAQRTIAIIGVAVLVLGVVGLTSWLSRPTYTPLYTGLAGSDANAIVEQLRGAGVDYELADGGSTIMVPEEVVYEQRLVAAAAGLPADNTDGYSLLDEMGVTSSEFQQSVTYKRALEGELAATISAMSGIQSATVQLALPEETVFVDEKLPPTASVFVQGEPGKELSTDQVESIIHLTSASIEGMKSTDVAVIAADGTVLSAVGVGATGSANSGSADYEETVTANIQRLLDGIVGAGNSRVAVAADVSYSSGERLEESYENPEDNPALNETTNTESYTGGRGGEAGVLGPDNIAVPDDEEGAGEYSSEESTRTNAVNKVTETTTTPAGALTRQSVSVAINDAVTGVNVGQVSALVAGAAGIDADRGDTVTVEMVAFDASAAASAQEALAAAEAAAEQEAHDKLVRTGIIAGVIILIALIALILFLISRRGRQREELDLSFQPAAAFEAIPEPAEDVHVQPKPIERPEPATSVIGPPPFLDAPGDVERKRGELAAMAQAEPEKTAERLRSLMSTGQGA